MSAVEIHCMQGRLVPPEGGAFQAFPASTWDKEFALAEAAEIDGIEWIYGSYGEHENPLLSQTGRERLRLAAERHGVVVHSLCADWFMDQPIAEDPARGDQLRTLVAAAGQAGIRRIVLPCVDHSSLRGETDVDALVRAVSDSLEALESAGVELHLETDLSPDRFAALLERLDHPLIRANYDTGNSASWGYDPQEEWACYGARVGSIHVKDRLRGGGTVPLGEGDANLECVFDLLVRRRWDRPLVLQVARGREGDEVPCVRSASRRVRDLWESQTKLQVRDNERGPAHPQSP